MTSTVPHMVSELRARLGERMADPRAIEQGIAALRAEYHASPAAWALVERIALTLGGHLPSPTTPAPRPCLAVVDGGLSRCA